MAGDGSPSPNFLKFSSMNWFLRLFLLRKCDCSIKLSTHWVSGGHSVYMQRDIYGTAAAMAVCMVQAMDDDDVFRSAVEIAAQEYRDPTRTKHSLTKCSHVTNS